MQSSVQCILGNSYKVKIIKVNKLNGVSLQSTFIENKNETVTPNIYLEEYYLQYQDGHSIEELAVDIVSKYFHFDKCAELSVLLHLDFEMVKDRLFIKLINYDKNKDLLEIMPHVRWLDLAIVFAVLVKKEDEGIGSFNIKNELMENWNVDTATIYNYAIKNTPILFGLSVRLLDDIIRESVVKKFCNTVDEEAFNTMMNTLLPKENNEKHHRMYVATNSLGINGSSVILYKEELHSLSDRLNSNLYILPSSIHEVIIVPAEDNIDKEQLLNMVKEVNETQVPIQEVLSDNVYYFNRETDEVYSLIGCKEKIL